MRFGTVLAADLLESGRRMTGSFHLSEDESATRALRHFDSNSDLLSDLVGGRRIFKGQIFRRRYVEDPRLGRPYVSPNDLDRVFIEPSGYLSPKLGARLEELALVEGMVLVTRSGMTLGKALWTREDMSGQVASDDLIRIEIDSRRAPPGYVYAFLASRFGRVAIRQQTYGGSIKHIEPHHLAGLRIPRLGSSVELKIHNLVLRSSRGVSQHVALMRQATDSVLRAVGISDPGTFRWNTDERRFGWAKSDLSSLSLRAMNFDPRATDLREALERTNRTTPLGKLCVPQWFKGKIIFTRIDAEPQFGALLLGQRKAFRPRPEGRWISRKSIKGLGLQVPAGTTLIPSHGTLGENELYCRALYVTPRMSSHAFSGDFFRCIPAEGAINPGYLHAFLRSEFAFRLLRSISTGGKQQEQHPVMMWNLPIPRLEASEEARVGALVNVAAEELDAAMSAEDEAERLLEESIRRES